MSFNLTCHTMHVPIWKYWVPQNFLLLGGDEKLQTIVKETLDDPDNTPIRVYYLSSYKSLGGGRDFTNTVFSFSKYRNFRVKL